MSEFERTAMMLQRGKAMYEVFFLRAGKSINHVGPFHSLPEARAYGRRYIRGWRGARIVYRIKQYGVDFNPKGRSRRNAPVKIRRVGGAQAEMALRSLGLVKVDTASAERLFNAGVKLVIVNAKVNDYHFFKGWHLAMEVDPARYKAENWTFKKFLNNWSYYNENTELGKAAFFVDKKSLV